MATFTQNRLNRAKDRKVRVIAKIRGLTHADSSVTENGAAKQWISVHKPPEGDESDSVIISLREQSLTSRKESYEVNFCYDQTQGNDVIFAREVNPLIPGVFEGHNATVIVCGARGSGKTYMIQGHEGEPGLALQAMSKIIAMAEEFGKTIAISCYEIFQERVFDLLDPRLEEVSVLNDGRGKTQLKGLSQVSVASLSEFQELFACVYTPQKFAKKVQNELPQRRHKGLIVQVFSYFDVKSEAILVGKMNFVELAGYKDPRRKVVDGYNLGESAKINKSIYALKNVLHSLNSNGMHVPYRESVLTRILQDSLEGTSRILLATCLNSSFCQDSFYMLSLISHSCQKANRSVVDSEKKNKRLARMNMLSSPKVREPLSVISTVKRQILSRTNFSEKKSKDQACVLKARKLFSESSKLKTDKPRMQASFTKIISKADSSFEDEAQLTSDVTQEIVSLENISLLSLDTANSVCQVVQEESPLADCNNLEATTSKTMTDILQSKEKLEETTPINTKEDCNTPGEINNKESNSVFIKRAGSPPISSRLRELSNNLKLLCSPTPFCLEITSENDATIQCQSPTNSNTVEPTTIDATTQYENSTNMVEPRTPDHTGTIADNAGEVLNSCNPWEAFSARSVGVKNSLVQEYLKFLNTAGKEELKKLKGIGEKRATYILELREESPVPFNDPDDLKQIGLSAKQVQKMMKTQMGDLFD